jgi:hypothetical protein
MGKKLNPNFEMFRCGDQIAIADSCNGVNKFLERIHLSVELDDFMIHEKGWWQVVALDNTCKLLNNYRDSVDKTEFDPKDESFFRYNNGRDV